MSSQREQSYRRALRLLPEGYRRVWAEDMVAAYLDSTEHSTRIRPTLAERLSVVSLAIRLRLNGSYAAPRWALWYRVVHGIALLVLLYQSVAATAKAVYMIGFFTQLDPVLVGPWYQPMVLDPFVGLLWVPAFGCLVLRRFVATRILATGAALTSLGVTLAIVQAYGHQPFGLGDASRWGWLALSAAVVFVTPTDARSSPWLWFGAWLVGSVVVTAFGLSTLGVQSADSWSRSWLRIADLTGLSTIALIAALAFVLGRNWPGRAGGSPHWLLSLGIVAAGIGGIRLARWSQLVVPPFETPAPVSLETILAIVLVGLAIVAIPTGLLAWQRSVAAAREP